MTNSDLARAFADLNDEIALNIVKEKIGAGVDPLEIVKELQAGMEIFGEQCKKGDFFISDLILAGEVFQQSMLLLEPLLRNQAAVEDGYKIVLGTVKGDIHNLGKDIFGVLLKASGFEVYDLGINVAPAAFVQKLRETGSAMLGLSGLITPSFDAMKATIEALEAAGLRSKVKVIIGGGVVSEIARQHTGADAFTTDAMQGVDWCKKMAGRNQA
jgi:methanogenic corrinoid protein MtbC1